MDLSRQKTKSLNKTSKQQQQQQEKQKQPLHIAFIALCNSITEETSSRILRYG